MTNIDEKQFEGLSESEKRYALKILEEFSKDGKSDTYNDLLYADYKEVPVDIITFISDDRYLGNAWKDSSGKLKLFPFWQEKLKELFPDNLTTSVNNFIESGARGIGKSEVAVTSILYLMYRLMCLKNPHEFLHLKPTEKVAFAFMNITKALSEEIASDKFQKTVQLSPWFLERGTITGVTNKIWNPPDWIDIIIGSQSSHVIGQPIYAAFFDEISFIRNQDIEKQKRIAIDMIDTALGGMQTRFIYNGKNPTLMILASSKRSDKSFLEEHMKKKLADEDASVMIVDKPVWEVRPPETYSGERFSVAVGNRFLVSEIVPDGFEDDYAMRGYNIISVPIELRSSFRDDIDRALCDYAGISSSDLSKYISGARVQAAISNQYRNPFQQDIIEVGNAPDDNVQYKDYFDLSKVPSRLKARPLYIHLDMSISGDKTGIAGVWISGKRNSLENSSKELLYQMAFAVSVKAPKGYQVSFAKNREFIYWLKSQGFNIKGISTDTFQNAAIAQDFMSKGYNYQVISVDRVNQQSHICEPYAFFKNCIYEQRIVLLSSKLLVQELTGLERNGNTGKIDHPDGGTSGCFIGDTKVSLVDGRDLSFFDLVREFESGKENYVYSFNEKTQRIEPKRILKAWRTKENASLINVTLDNDEQIICTPNHLFMLRDGSYCEAKNLKENQSLMPLYRKQPSNSPMNGYRLYYEPMEDSWHYEHRAFATEVLDEKYLVHHKNCNKSDNTPSNLIWMSKEQHQKIHAKMQTGAHSPEVEKKRSNSLSSYYRNNRCSDDFIARNQKISKTLKERNNTEEASKRRLGQEERHQRFLISKENSIKKKAEKEQHIKEIEETFGVVYSELSKGERNSYGVKLSRIKNPDIQKRISQSVSENHKLGKYKNAYDALQVSNQYRHENGRTDIEKQHMSESKIGKKHTQETKDKLSQITSKRRWYNNGEQSIYIFSWEDVPEGFVPGRLKTWKNHKVKKIQFLDYTQDVYDIEVEDNHNFALASGVFVHNSKDMSDATCGALWNASQHAEEYAFEFGEDLDSIHESNILGDDSPNYKQQILIDMEEELKGFRLFPSGQEERKEIGLDFGMGRAKLATGPYVADSILVW